VRNRYGDGGKHLCESHCSFEKEEKQLNKGIIKNLRLPWNGEARNGTNNQTVKKHRMSNDMFPHMTIREEVTHPSVVQTGVPHDRGEENHSVIFGKQSAPDNPEKPTEGLRGENYNGAVTF